MPSLRSPSRAAPSAPTPPPREVGFYAEPGAAQVALASLQAAGLAASLVPVRPQPAPRRRPRGYSLRVTEGERELAAQLLATDWSAEAWAASGFNPAEERCARCGGSAWEPAGRRPWSQLLGLLGLRGSARRCASCGARESQPG